MTQTNDRTGKKDTKTTKKDENHDKNEEDDILTIYPMNTPCKQFNTLHYKKKRKKTGSLLL